jgi:two-component system chemotaxis response regulator CheB
MAIRVVIAAEPFLLGALGRALPSPEFDVVASLTGSTQILQRCKDLNHQLVLVQISLAERDSLVCIQDVMAFSPTPILMIAGPGEEPSHAFKALAYGALDAVRFEGTPHIGELVHRARLLAGVRVITHVRARRERRDSAQPPIGGRLVAMAASLGGPRALAQVLGDLRPGISAPILIVQHISDGFSEGLAHWLATETRQPVREAHDGQLITPGMIVVAPSRQHLEVREGKIALTDDPPEGGGFRPSATALFRSVARWYGPRGIGVVLTGMGADGAEGLLAMRRQGARTIAQDESTCVVYGMPKAAREIGAVEQQVALDHVAPALRRILEG